MESVLIKIIRVFIFIFIGFFIKKTGLTSKKGGKKLEALSFNLLLPIVVIINIWVIELNEIVNYHLMFSFFGSGILVFGLSFIIGKYLYQFEDYKCAVYGFSSCYGNLVGLGIPLAFSILGTSLAIPFMGLALFHGIIHLSYSILIIEILRNPNLIKFDLIIKYILGLMQNSILLSMILGLVFNYYNVPFPDLLQKIIIPVSNIALPIVLISVGLNISGFKMSHYYKEITTLTILKNFVHPIIAFVLAKYVFQLPSKLVFISTLASSLPSGIQTYYLSYRYSALRSIASTNIVISTVISIFTISLIVYLFDY